MAGLRYGRVRLEQTIAPSRVSTTALDNSEYVECLLLLPDRVRRGVVARATILKARPEAVLLAAVEHGLRSLGTSHIIEAQRRVEPLMDQRPKRTP